MSKLPSGHIADDAVGGASHLREGDIVIKERVIWNPRSLQLLREQATVRYALRVAPRMVDGIRVDFPETEVSLGFRVRAQSRRIKGRNLLEMIYDPETQGFALDMAMVALKALNNANVTFEPFVLFGAAYGWVRRLKVTLSEMTGTPILSSEQRVKLSCLASSYTKDRRGERKALLHGDLHAANVVVDCEENSLGFVDLEMMHIGKPVTNFAQLWISFHFADPSLGKRFYSRYVDQFSETLNEHFDSDARAEIALRCYVLVRGAKKSGHAELEKKARVLLASVLHSQSFEKMVVYCEKT